MGFNFWYLLLGDVTSKQMREELKAKIDDVIRLHGVQVGMQSTGNLGRAILRPDVSEAIVRVAVEDLLDPGVSKYISTYECT